jgi:hypothetical protein
MERKRSRRTWSIKEELIQKSRQSALAAIKVFNDPLIYFKSESFIVLMIISWTYFMHAYYRSRDIDYRYFKQIGGKKRFDRTSNGAYKHWELEKCLNFDSCPLDKDTQNNLRFLINLRHEIEHQMTMSLDNYLSGRYQACIMNLNNYMKQFFGEKYGLDEHLTYSLQFMELSDEQISGPIPEAQIPERLKNFIIRFDNNLSKNEYNNTRYSFRMFFSKKLVNRSGQADKVVEFIDPNSELAKTISHELWVKKDVEKPKFRPTDVVREVQKAGYPKFLVQPHHLELWRNEDAKNTAKGYGVNVQGVWYWYENWVKKCIELCEHAGDRYK